VFVSSDINITVDTYFDSILKEEKKEKKYTARMFESSAYKHHCGHIVREIQYYNREKGENIYIYIYILHGCLRALSINITVNTSFVRFNITRGEKGGEQEIEEY